MCRIGKFDVDWRSDEASKYEICESHLQIFLLDWKNPFWQNYKIRDGYALCSYPEHEGATITVTRDRVNLTNKSDCERWLAKKNTLLRVGIPICETDMNILRGVEFDAEQSNHLVSTPRTPRRLTECKLSKGAQDAYKNVFVEMNCSENVDRRKDFVDLGDRQQRERVRVFRIGVDGMAEFMAPDAPDELKKRAFKGEKISPVDRYDEVKDLLSYAADLYERADSKLIRLSVVAGVARFPLPLLQKYFPGLTSYCHQQARDLYDRKAPVVKGPIVRVRYDDQAVNKLLEFVQSPLVCINLPWNERKEQMDGGSTMTMPNLVRLQTIDEVYRMYLMYLQEEVQADNALKETQAKYIINLVAPTRRKSAPLAVYASLPLSRLYNPVCVFHLTAYFI